MPHDELHEPFRTSTDAHRLATLGFHLAEQVITADAGARERWDEGFRVDLVPVRELLRPHVYSDREARDEACRSPMPGGVLALVPVDAGEVFFRWRTSCLFAIGHGIDDHGFEDVALAIAEPEVVSLVGAWRRGRGAGGTRGAHSIILTVAGAHYQLVIDEAGRPEARAKVPFDVVSRDELERTAAWLLGLLARRLDPEAGPRSSA
jgi:hypothetical protein